MAKLPEGGCVKTTCPYCGVGCGVIVEKTVEGFAVKGDPDHPANFGRLCSKGSALAETLGTEERLREPLIDGQPGSWDEATGKIAANFTRIIDEHGPDAVALYLSGQILTEDYYIANKLMKGYVGTANVDTNSRLCMASSVAGHKRAFGSDTVPGTYEDLEQADLLVLVGSNLAWCHPVLFQRVRAAKEARPHMRVVVIDPRRTATCDLADLHLPISPGGDVALFMGLLNALDRAGKTDEEFVEAHTNGVDEALIAAQAFDVEATAMRTGLRENDLRCFFDWVVQTQKTVTVYSQGVNQSKDGTDKVNTIINTHLLTGRIGQPGMGPFSVTGQPNAMGGREVGGLANQLASHMDLGNPAHRDLLRRFWDAPTMASAQGLKAVDLFDAIYDGKVKAVWIMGTNPVVSLPEADKVREALKRCELVVVSDMTANTDTAKLANILLPAATWGEKEGMVTNSERRMSRQRAFVDPVGEARADWMQIRDVAIKMGFESGFAFDSPYEIFQEYAALCSFENAGTRDLDLSGLLNQSADEYEQFAPAQWPIAKGGKVKQRFFADGQFFTGDGRANFIVPDAKGEPGESGFVLNTGRVRDHWHTMTRTGLAARLSQHIAEPFVEIAEADAASLGVAAADLVRLHNSHGAMLARAVVTDRQQPGSVFVPMHWTDEFASAGRVDALVTGRVDPISGQPASKGARTQLERYNAKWYGFAVVRLGAFADTKLDVAYWAKARVAGGWRIEMAGKKPLDEDALLSCIDGDRLVYDDGAQRRVAIFRGNELQAALYMAPQPVAVARDWAVGLLQQEIEPAGRSAILAGRAGAGMADKGAIVCSCMQVGVNDLKRAAKAGACSVDELGGATGAGTNCGSCRSELLQFLPDHSAAIAAE